MTKGVGMCSHDLWACLHFLTRSYVFEALSVIKERVSAFPKFILSYLLIECSL